MKYRRRQRWLRRLALGFAFATALFAGKASVAAAVVDEGTGTRVVAVTPSGDEVAFGNAIASQDPYLTDVFVRQGESLGGPDGSAAGSSGILGVTTATQQQVTPYRSPGILGEAIKSQQATTPAAATRPDDRAIRFTGVEQPQASRPDDRADRFAHSDVPAPTAPTSGGWNVEWNEALAVGIGALVLALAFGLGVGYLRRPRIAL